MLYMLSFYKHSGHTHGMHESMNRHRSGQSVRHRLRAWFVGLLVLSGLILLVSHFGELGQFVRLVRQAEPSWLILAFLLQLATYLSVATVWYLALRQAGQRHSLLSLVPLGIAKLFSDQAMPSGGMSGMAFFITALSRRGVPAQVCMATLLLSLVSFYGAYLIAVLATVLLLYLKHALHVWIMLAVGVFALVAVGIPAGVLWLRSVAERDLPAPLLRIPGLDKLMDAIANAPRELLRSPALLVAAILCHGAVFVLDATTLWVMLQVVGNPASFWIVFPSFVLASMVTTVGPIPLGLGTFELTCVSVLSLLGAPIEAALAATLLLRGFTLWLPMFPGMWLASWALR